MHILVNMHTPSHTDKNDKISKCPFLLNLKNTMHNIEMLFFICQHGKIKKFEGNPPEQREGG